MLLQLFAFLLLLDSSSVHTKEWYFVVVVPIDAALYDFLLALHNSNLTSILNRS